MWSLTLEDFIRLSCITNADNDKRIKNDLKENRWSYLEEEDWNLEDRCLCTSVDTEGADIMLFEPNVDWPRWTNLNSKNDLLGCWFRIVRLNDYEDAMFVVFTDPADTNIVGWFYNID
jgi:hypothetical protein